MSIFFCYQLYGTYVIRSEKLNIYTERGKVINDGTNIRYLEPGTKLPDRYQAHILFEDESALLCTMQMLCKLR